MPAISSGFYVAKLLICLGFLCFGLLRFTVVFFRPASVANDFLSADCSKTAAWRRFTLLECDLLEGSIIVTTVVRHVGLVSESRIFRWRYPFRYLKNTVQIDGEMIGNVQYRPFTGTLLFRC